MMCNARFHCVQVLILIAFSSIESISGSITYHYSSVNNHTHKTVDDDVFDDQTPATHVCYDYLQKFLDPSTDISDQCDGLENAHDELDCFGSLDNIKNRHVRRLEDEKDDDEITIDDKIQEALCCDTIHDLYEEHCHKKKVDAKRLCAVSATLVLCAVIKSFISYYEIRCLSDFAAYILLGLLIGVITKYATHHSVDDIFSDDDFFLYLLLPPIIFNASLTINKPAFFEHLLPIFLYAIVGTFISSFSTGFLVYGITQCTEASKIPVLESLIFGALISSIDPIAVLSILGSMGVSDDNTLYSTLAGESLLNDAVAIVLFETLVRFLDDDVETDTSAILSAILRFFVVSFGSLAIGIVSAMCCCIFYWGLRDRQTAIVEVGVFYMWAMIPYYISYILDWSGIVSLVAAGLIMDIYIIGEHPRNVVSYRDHAGSEVMFSITSSPILTRSEGCLPFLDRNGQLSPEAKAHVNFVAEVISSLSETVIFVYLGIFFWRDYSWNVVLITGAIFSCIFGRALMIAVVSALANWLMKMGFKGQFWTTTVDDLNAEEERTLHISKEDQLLLFVAGLRGAVSIALVENITVYDPATGDGSEYKSDLKQMTNVAILFTIFVFGGCTFYIVNYFKDLEECDQSIFTGSYFFNDFGSSYYSNDPLLNTEEISSADSNASAHINRYTR